MCTAVPCSIPGDDTGVATILPWQRHAAGTERSVTREGSLGARGARAPAHLGVFKQFKQTEQTKRAEHWA